MAAVELPPQEAPIEAHPEHSGGEPSVAEPEQPASPEVEAPTGDAPQEAEPEAGKVADLLKDISAEELRLLVEQASPEVREKALAEQIKRAEQRGETRTREQYESRTQRTSAYEEGIRNGDQWGQWLDQQADTVSPLINALNYAMQQGDEQMARGYLSQIAQNLTPDNLKGARTAIEVAARFKAASDQDQQLKGFIRKHGDLFQGDLAITEEEAEALNNLTYNDGRTGKTDTAFRMFDLLLERAEKRGEAKGLEKGRGEKEASAKLAEKLAGLADAKANAAPSLNGAAAPAGPRSLAEAESAYNANPSPENHKALQAWYAKTPGYQSLVQ